MENYKHSCVIDANGVYVDLVLVLLPDKGEPEVQGYTLHEGESIIDFEPPEIKKKAGDNGFVAPKWDGTKWVESATAEQIAALAPTLEQARAAATERISGKCSAAIYSGVTVDGKHYRLTENDQLALNAAIGLATSTGESISYAADGEAGTRMTAVQLSAIGKAGYDWGYVCRSYYGLLYTWVQRETDTDKLAAIHFGSVLPDDLMQTLTSTLAGAGIDLSKYAAALSA